MSSISRRDFLRISKFGALSLGLDLFNLDHLRPAPPASHGRIIKSGIAMFAEPKFKANQTHVFGRDEVVQLSAEVDGDEGNPFNKVWYQVNGEGYTYSGWVQPVETVYQRPILNLPEGGQLGEIMVPVCVSRLEPHVFARNGLRLFYGSTHWVKNVVVTNQEKSLWYQIFDSHLKVSFYVPCHEMRLVPDAELLPISPEVAEFSKSILIDLGLQLVTAFEADLPVFSARCSSGAKGTWTPMGEFRTYHKGPSIHMNNEGDAVDDFYDLPGVPWVTFFTSEGVAFHGTYWHNDFGRPRSHGCVNLPVHAAKFLYRWTRPFVPIGTEYLHRPGEGTRVVVMNSKLVN